MLGFFNMKPSEDPCERGNTVVANGIVSNTGKSTCQITLNVPVLKGVTNLKIGFDVPLEVRGAISKPADTMLIDFSQSAQSTIPVFWIDNKPLNDDWGGHILRFSYGPTEVIVTTDNACIKYIYDTKPS